MEKENGPIKTLREGPIGVSIWEKQTRNGVMYSYEISRAYKRDSSEEFEYAKTFNARHANAIADLVEQAAEWIDQRCENAETVTIAA